MHLRDYEVRYEEKSGAWQIQRASRPRGTLSLLVAFMDRGAAVSAAEGLCVQIAEKTCKVGLTVRTRSGTVESKRVFGDTGEIAKPAG